MKLFFLYVTICHLLKVRKESDTYLTTVCRHHWSRQMMMKVDKLLPLQLMKATVLAEAPVIFLLSSSSVCSSDVYRQ
jgi:hypothetical protein